MFANTIKYVLMGTSSNFGNMFSAAGASAILSFLPMLPGQILLNNLLYDTSQLAIPTDHVDDEQLRRPSHWDIGFIRRFMLFFGPISSLFDFLTFGVMLGAFHAGPGAVPHRLVRRVAGDPDAGDLRRPYPAGAVLAEPAERPLVASAVGITAIGALLPLTPLAGPLGFIGLPIAFFGVLVLLVIGYLFLIEFGKRLFYAESNADEDGRRRGRRHRLERRAARFSARRPIDA